MSKSFFEQNPEYCLGDTVTLEEGERRILEEKAPEEKVLDAGAVRREGESFFRTGERTVTGSHQIPVVTDKLLSEVDFDKVDVIVLPGGPGTKDLEACGPLMEQVDAFVKADRPVSAICAAPEHPGAQGSFKRQGSLQLSVL